MDIRQHYADLRELVETVATSILDVPAPEGRIRWRVDVPPVALRSAQAATLALVLHELFTNCVKHAFRMGAGAVTVGGRLDNRDLHLTVCDDGPGPPVEGIRPGTGLAIVETLVTHTLRGGLWQAVAREGGCLTHLRVPLGDEAASTEST